MMRKLNSQLTVLLVGLVGFSVGLFGLLAYNLANNAVEDELGRSLVTVAKLAARDLAEEDLASLVPGGKALAQLEQRLSEMALESDLERLVLFDVGQKVLVDSRGEAQMGSEYHILKLDLLEWRWALKGKASDTPLFSGKDQQVFKSALAPVVDLNGEVVAVVRVEAAARFLAVIQTFALSMVVMGLVCLGLALVLAAWASKPIVEPLRELISASRRVAGGDFGARIKARGRGEIAEAVHTFNEMAEQLGSFVAEKERMATLGELSAGVAHEIRNPLAAIEGFAGLIEKKLATKDPLREHAIDIVNEVRILNRFITDFLDFSRPSPPRLEVLELRGLVESAARIALPPARGKKKKWEIEFKGSQVLAVADPDQLRQVVINLVKNACDAMEAGGSVKVQVKKKGNMAVVEVEDSGKGMNKAARESLFTPFYSTKPMGTGLGLSIVAKLLEGLGGTIQVKSEPDKGSRFSIFLPHEMNAEL